MALFIAEDNAVEERHDCGGRGGLLGRKILPDWPAEVGDEKRKVVVKNVGTDTSILDEGGGLRRHEWRFMKTRVE